jgi:hypothetical protein
MALIKPSSLIDEIRNKMGSVVFSSGNGGQYARSLVIPYNPQSVDQVSARNRLITASQAWSGLTANQRTAWNLAAPDWERSGVFGQKVKLSGFNLYCFLNINLAIVGVAPISSPPAKTAVPALTALSATQVHAGATTMVFTPTPLTAGASYVVEATSPQSAGKSFVSSEYRIIKFVAAGQTSPQVLTTDYNAKFGSPGLAGQRVFFRVTAISTTTGQPGASLDCVATVS